MRSREVMKQYLLIVFVLISQSGAFNVDIHEPIVRGTLQNDDFYDSVNKDMFGYRVALYNRSDGPRYDHVYEECSIITCLSYYNTERSFWNVYTGVHIYG